MSIYANEICALVCIDEAYMHIITTLMCVHTHIKYAQKVCTYAHIICAHVFIDEGIGAHYLQNTHVQTFQSLMHIFSQEQTQLPYLEIFCLFVQIVKTDTISGTFVGQELGYCIEVLLDALSFRSRCKIYKFLYEDSLFFLGPICMYITYVSCMYIYVCMYVCVYVCI